MRAHIVAWPGAEDPVSAERRGQIVIYNGHVKVNVSEFKAKCLSLVDKAAHGEEVRIMKRGKVVARLIADAEVQPKPWLALRNTPAVWHGDPFAPAVESTDVVAEQG